MNLETTVSIKAKFLRNIYTYCDMGKFAASLIEYGLLSAHLLVL